MEGNKMKLGLIIGMTIAASAVGGILYIKNKGKKEENDISATVFDAMLKDDTNKGKLKGLDINEIKRTVSRGINKGVGKLKAITDAWEAHENGIAQAGVEKTEFEKSCEDSLDLSDLVDDVGEGAEDTDLVEEKLEEQLELTENEEKGEDIQEGVKSLEEAIPVNMLDLFKDDEDLEENLEENIEDTEDIEKENDKGKN